MKQQKGKKDSGGLESPELWSEFERTHAQVTEAEEKYAGLDLVELKDFLNAQLGEGDLEDRKLREEILGMIAPIIGAEVGSKRVLESLQEIAEKLNGLEVKGAWEVMEEPPEKVGEFESGMLHRLWAAKLGPGRGILKLGGRKYTFRHEWGEGNPKQEYLLTIASALEDGTFPKLKRCKQCSRFFIAERLSDRFCSPECSKAHFGGAVARERVYGIRAGQRNLGRLLDLATEGRTPVEYREALQLWGEGNPKEGLQRALELKRKLDKGTPIGKLWRGIPKEVKGRLREMK